MGANGPFFKSPSTAVQRWALRGWVWLGRASVRLGKARARGPMARDTEHRASMRSVGLGTARQGQARRGRVGLGQARARVPMAHVNHEKAAVLGWAWSGEAVQGRARAR